MCPTRGYGPAIVGWAMLAAVTWSTTYGTVLGNELWYKTGHIASGELSGMSRGAKDRGVGATMTPGGPISLGVDLDKTISCMVPTRSWQATGCTCPLYPLAVPGPADDGAAVHGEAMMWIPYIGVVSLSYSVTGRDLDFGDRKLTLTIE